VGSLQDFYSVTAAAKEIGIERMTLYQRIHRGKVKHEKVSDTVTLIPRDEVLRLKEEEAERRGRAA
jgi:excisionase family DNA binding protein